MANQTNAFGSTSTHFYSPQATDCALQCVSCEILLSQTLLCLTRGPNIWALGFKSQALAFDVTGINIVFK